MRKMPVSVPVASDAVSASMMSFVGDRTRVILIQLLFHSPLWFAPVRVSVPQDRAKLLYPRPVYAVAGCDSSVGQENAGGSGDASLNIKKRSTFGVGTF